MAKGIERWEKKVSDDRLNDDRDRAIKVEGASERARGSSQAEVCPTVRESDRRTERGEREKVTSDRRANGRGQGGQGTTAHSLLGTWLSGRLLASRGKDCLPQTIQPVDLVPTQWHGAGRGHAHQRSIGPAVAFGEWVPHAGGLSPNLRASA